MATETFAASSGRVGSGGTPEATRPGTPSTRLTRCAVACGVAWAIAGLVWTASPIGGLLLVLTGVVLVWRLQVSTHVAAAAAPVGILLGWCAIGVPLSLLDPPLLASPVSWFAAWAGVAVAVTAVGYKVLGYLTTNPAGVHSSPRRVRGRDRLFLVPSALVGGIALLQGSSTDLVMRWIGYGTDPLVQLLLVQQIAREGSLAYGLNDGSRGDVVQQAYPKGVHWLVATVVQPVMGGDDPSSSYAYEAYVRTFGAFVWLSIGVLLLVAAGVLLALTARRSVPRSVTGTSLVFLVLLIAVPTQFAMVVVIQGGIGAATAVAAYWALWWPLVSSARLRVTLAVGLVALVAVSNAWQPLLPIVAMTLILALVPRGGEVWRGVRRLSLPAGRSAGLVLAATTLLLVGALPLTSLILAGGAGAATIPGGIIVPNLVVVAIGVPICVAATMIGLRRGDWQLAGGFAGFAVGSLFVWSAMVVAAHGVASAYYPTKVMWFVTVFAWPLVALGLGVGMVWLWRRATPLHRLVATVWRPYWSKAALIGSSLVVLAAGLPWVMSFPTPFIGAAAGLQRPAMGAEVGLLPEAERGTYVPLLLDPLRDRSGITEKIASQALRFRFGEPWNPLNRAVTSCAMLRLADPAIIVTGLDPGEVPGVLAGLKCQVSGYRTLQLR